MTPEELGKWLSENLDEIYTFMDYEATIDSEKELAVTLGHWLGSDFWATTKHRFIHLGIDGAGSQFAAWIRPGETQIPVVFFGSEGGAGALATSCKNWAKTIAYAPAIEEYTEPGHRRLDPGQNWKIDGDEVGQDQADEAKAAQATYRAAVEKRLGKMPSLHQLMTDLDKVDAEFVQWVASVTDH